jgi:hypothetical protein
VTGDQQHPQPSVTSPSPGRGKGVKGTVVRAAFGPVHSRPNATTTATRSTGPALTAQPLDAREPSPPAKQLTTEGMPPSLQVTAKRCHGIQAGASLLDQPPLRARPSFGTETDRREQRNCPDRNAPGKEPDRQHHDPDTNNR